MPARSAIRSLPPDLLNDLGVRLKHSGFQNLTGHLEWLNGEIARRGMDLRIGRSALGKWSKARKEKADAALKEVEFATGMAAIAGDLLSDIEAATLMEQQMTAYKQARSFRGIDFAGLDIEEQVALFRASSALSLNQKRMVETELRRRQLQMADEPKADNPAQEEAGADGAVARSQGLSDEVMDAIDEVLMPAGEAS